MLDGLQGIFQLAKRKLNEVENQNGIHQGVVGQGEGRAAGAAAVAPDH